MLSSVSTYPFVSFCLVSGNSEGISELSAFDQALRNSGVGDLNLLRLSSILPARMTYLPTVPPIPKGSFLPCAYSKLTSAVRNQTIACAVAVAVPADADAIGLIMEYSMHGSKEEALDNVRRMCVEGMQRRNVAVAEILSVGAEHTVLEHGAVFAGLFFWKKP